MARSRMNVTVKTASVRPTRSSTALDNAAARPLSISRNRWRLMISTRLEVDLLVVLIVSLDDHLHQLMADDVALVEVDERYSDRKSIRLNSSHITISYAVFCLKKKKKK